ncbi:MAG: NUDIX domain-containing protein [Bryobacterales bacterium]
MAHLFYDLDFTVSVFIVHGNQVLLVHHRKLEKWLPVGGHIEIGEDPETAAKREAKEESGLEIELVGDRPPREFPGTTILTAPSYLDIHDIKGDHRHIGMIYSRGRPVPKSRWPSNHAIRWSRISSKSWATPPGKFPRRSSSTAPRRCGVSGWSKA